LLGAGCALRKRRLGIQAQVSYLLTYLLPSALLARMGASPCLPPCTDARGPLCLKLVNGEGKLCQPRTTHGPSACSALHSCGSDCANQWLIPMQLFRSITRRHHWLLFIGDSDTRGLVFGLLQLLATAGYGAELASHSRALWLGGANNDSQAAMGQASRICHVDFSYDADARQVRIRANASPSPSPSPIALTLSVRC